MEKFNFAKASTWQVIQDALNLLAPPNCLVCKNYIPSTGFCNSCIPDDSLKINFSSKSCIRCGEDTASGICPLCQLAPLKCGQLRSIWFYAAQIKEIVKHYKYAQRLGISNFLVQQLTLGVSSFSTNNWDIILCIPSSWSQSRARELHHLHPVIRKLSKNLGIAYSTKALYSTRERSAQSSLALNNRVKNVLEAFAVNKGAVAGKKVLLVDDILTTGASVNSATEVILGAGGANVDVLTFCRSPRFRINRISAYREKELPQEILQNTNPIDLTIPTY